MRCVSQEKLRKLKQAEKKVELGEWLRELLTWLSLQKKEHSVKRTSQISR